MVVATEQCCWEKILVFLNYILIVHCISKRKPYPFVESLIRGVNPRLASKWNERSGHLPIDFVGHWIALL